VLLLFYMLKKIILIVLISIPISNILAQNKNIILIARTSYHDGHNLPAQSFFLNSSPEINNKREIVFRLITVAGLDRRGIWSGNSEGGKITYRLPEEDYISDPHINAKSEVVFSKYNTHKGYGIYKYTMQKTTPYLHISLNEKLKINNYQTPFIDDNSRISSRAYHMHNRKSVILIDEKEIKTLLFENINGKLPIAYIYNIDTNKKGQIAVKINRGKKIESRGKEEIITLDKNGGIKSVAKSVKLDPSSPYQYFRNSLSINNKSQVAFIARLKNGKDSLLLYEENKGLKEIITVPNKNIKEIEYFKVRLNNRGNIAFRALDKHNKYAIYLYKDQRIHKVLSQGDLLEVDIGTVQINTSSGPPFGGNIGFNDHNDILLNANFSEKYDASNFISKAIILIVQDLVP